MRETRFDEGCWRWGALFVALVLVAAACGSSNDDAEVTPPESTPTEVPIEDPTAQPEDPTEVPTQPPTPEPELNEEEIAQLPLEVETIEWEDCGDLQCGTVDVPVDYDNPGAGTLSIAVNIARATDLDRRVGYLLVNPGGPGGTGIGYAALLAAIAPDELVSVFDIVGFDPRGVGISEPRFGCGDASEQFDLLVQIDAVPDTDAEIQLGTEAAQLCVDTMGDAAVQMGTDEVARDMDEIRKALGAEQISFYGASYGSRVGAWYATLFPDSVYSMVIDGAGNPLLATDTLDETLDTVRALFGPLHNQFEAALNSCVDQTCPIWNNGDPQGYWTSTAAKAQLIVDAAGGNTSAVLLSINGFLYSEEAWPALHRAVSALAEDDDPSLMLDIGYSRSTLGTDPTSARLSDHVNCLDIWALGTASSIEESVRLAEEFEGPVQDLIDEEFPLFGVVDVGEMGVACTFYGVLDLSPALTGDFDGGGAAILVIGNTSDQITPFVQSQQLVTDVLANGFLVTVDHGKHVVYPENECVNEAVHAALIDQEYNNVDCDREVAGNDWETVELVETQLANGAIALVPDGWQSVAEGVWVRATAAQEQQALLVYAPTGGTVEAGVTAVQDQFGETAELISEIPGDGETWFLHEMSLTEDGQDYLVLFAVSDHPDGAVILGQMTEVNAEQMIAEVLQPALEGYQRQS